MGPSELGAKLACPQCRGDLEATADGYTCPVCALAFPVVEGIPLLVVEDGKVTKQRQLSFFDEEADAEFEIERPRGQPRLYGWLLRDKFRRSVSGLASLRDTSVLTVCGGSGLDAEYLAARGASVVVSDLSPGAARRAVERARRHGVALAAVVGDVERLPFADKSFDLVYVHDGLHHLEDPQAGLAEMARVAGVGVSVTEPARAWITSVAIRFGVAGEYEEAGNRVARVTADEIATTLRDAGFAIVRVERYGMFYRHHPGPAMRFFSCRLTMPVATAALGVTNCLVGRFGNKLTVQALRAGAGARG